MYEQEKIDEAEYFYTQVSRYQEDRDKFKYNLSAFLAAARSVLQYACKEATAATAKKVGQKWYSHRMCDSNILTFFKDQRDLNIHEKPVNPRMKASVKIHSVVRISDSVELKLLDSDGNLKEHQVIKSSPPERTEPEPTKVSYQYWFSDWSGDEDVVSICRDYLGEVREMVLEGQNKGFLS